VSPNDAFSTLQPVSTRPSPVSPAAPTRSREYGAYARLATSMAAARNSGQLIAIQTTLRRVRHTGNPVQIR
jgi:hypothetical protein